ncbi:hypothetical protein MiSe_86230 [Microseira wollei NIES-4236]|uniref:Uncharacterized protein n=2 Tax=Microseira wollei TaxID=467598 RepID=A0AAV3XU19_9CYAN|nr:hypothetical protein MiSe_86230 [Microseira wollei NIES-4236]
MLIFPVCTQNPWETEPEINKETGFLATPLRQSCTYPRGTVLATNQFSFEL